MTLDKNKTVAEIGRRTRLRNHDVQRMLEALIEIWTEELAGGGRVEIEKFLVLEVKLADRVENAGTLLVGGKQHRVPRHINQLVVRPSKVVRLKLKTLKTQSKKDVPY